MDNNDSSIILRDALIAGDLETVFSLLTPETISSPILVNRRLMYPLHIAAKYHHYEIAKFLLESGADPNIKAGYSCQPIMISFFYHDEAMVRLFLQYGSNTNGYAAIYSIAQNFSILRIFLENGADPNERYTGGTLLHAAMRRDDMDLAKLLLDFGATVPILLLEENDGSVPISCSEEMKILFQQYEQEDIKEPSCL